MKYYLDYYPKNNNWNDTSLIEMNEGASWIVLQMMPKWELIWHSHMRFDGSKISLVDM